MKDKAISVSLVKIIRDLNSQGSFFFFSLTLPYGLICAQCSFKIHIVISTNVCACNGVQFICLRGIQYQTPIFCVSKMPVRVIDGGFQE